MTTGRSYRRGCDVGLQQTIRLVAVRLTLFMVLCGSAVAGWGQVGWGQVAAGYRSSGEPDLSDPLLWPEHGVEPPKRSPQARRQEALIAELSGLLPEFKAVRDHRDLVTYVRASGIDDATLEQILNRFGYIEFFDVGPNDLTQRSVKHLRGMGHLKRLKLELSSASPLQPGDLVPLAKSESIESIRIHGPKKGMSDPILSIDGVRRDAWNGVAAVTLRFGRALVLDRVVDEMPHLEALSLIDCDLPENSLKRLPELQNLEEVDLEFSRFAAAGVALENVSRIRNLKRLSLRLTYVTDPDVLRFEPLSGLQEINLGSARLGDAGVEHVVRQFPHLESLNLARVRQITDRSARAVSRLRQLRKLDVDWSEITDAGVGSLAGLPHLEDLALPSTITDRGLALVGRMSQMRRLRAAGAVDSDQGLASLAGLEKLELLDISHARITDAGLAHLAPLTRMRVLDLSESEIDGSGLKYLLGMRSLQYLNLQNTNVQPAHFAQLAELTSLRELILSGSPIGSDEGVETLKRFPFVQFIRVSLNSPASWEIFDALPHTYIYSE